jgi:hypothetical protein
MKNEWIVKEVNVSAIKPTPTNYKIKTDLGKERLAMSLKKFGLAGSVVCNTDLVLIDGNSRLLEAKEKGLKKIWVSMPKTKLSPKDFKEMSAMFDFAKAGEVDMERIEGDLGKTKDFFEQWKMNVPMYLLDKMGKNAPIAKYPDQTNAGSKGKTNAASEIGVSDIKMVNLFFSDKQEREFRKMEEKLAKRFKTKTTTDTVYAALKSIK